MSIENGSRIISVHCECQNAVCIASKMDDDHVLKTQKIDGQRERMSHISIGNPINTCEIFNNSEENKVVEIFNKGSDTLVPTKREIVYERDIESGRMVGKLVRD